MCRRVCVAICLAVPVTGFAQNSSTPANANAVKRLPDEAQAKLDKLGADLKSAETRKNTADAAKILNSVGDLYFSASEYPKALEVYQQALTRANAAPDLPQQAAALNGIGGCYRAQGASDKATGVFQQAMGIASRAGDLRGQATALNGLGWVSANTGQAQKALEYHSQALPLARQSGDRDLEATILRRMGVVYLNLGDAQKALDAFTQALQLYRAVGDRAAEAATLHNLGNVFSVLGENQKALDYYGQALPMERQVGARAAEAATLTNLGSVYTKLGENHRALDYFSQALPVLRAIGDHRTEGTALSNIGLMYYNLAEYRKALDYFNAALPIRRQVGDRVGISATLTGIGQVYSRLGEKQKALESYDQALPIEREVGDRASEATTLGDIGEVYATLGEDQKALDYYNQAVPILREVGEPSAEAKALSNMGNVYSAMGQNQKALDYYNQALPMERQVGDRASEASALNNIGFAYAMLGENVKALDFYNQALPISRQVGDRSNEALTLTNIGHVYAALGEKQKALDYYYQALPIAAFTNDPNAQATVLGCLFEVEKLDRPTLAILYGKQAINLLQQMRGNINGLQADVQKTFLASITDQYHDLAGLLIEEGRLPEAQQVLNLLKDEEYKSYVRGGSDEALGSLSLTPAELAAEEDYQRSTAQVVEQGRRWSELKQSKNKTSEQEKEFDSLSDSLGKASESMNSYFTRLYKRFSQGGDANRQVASITDEAASLKQQIAKMPHTVALYTVVSKDRYSVIVITGSTMVAREYVIPENDLHEKVAAFRQVIFDPTKDAKPMAQELYRILIGPIRADLEQAKAQTLIWSLDGVLRYVPLAALNDGKHYLVESYSLASFTPVSIPHISDKPDMSSVSAVGMGISAKMDEHLNPLPKVETELESVVRDPQMKGSDGVIPGTILLNAKFTEAAMEKQLDGQHAVVHIASHFVMRPGDDNQSYLLMAGKDGESAGYHLTVAEFRDNQKLSLEGTDLLTLSACDTGVGGSSENGREVDGLATTAQRKGAKAVISSLWQLNDSSTADLMSDFYKRWVDGGGKVMKVEALRQAQLDLLMGRVVAKADKNNPSAGTSYAQPYYWAPFVLMGNWQ